jgi:hypothetical protein
MAMDLDSSVRVIPGESSSRSTDQKPTQVSLFEAIRRWTNEEGSDAFEIEVGGKNLGRGQIEEIAHSDDYTNRLLSYNERR